MSEKDFSDVRGLKGDPAMQQVVIDLLEGDEPDNFIESAFGATVPGPPDPGAESDEKRLIGDLDAILERAMGGRALRYDSEG